MIDVHGPRSTTLHSVSHAPGGMTYVFRFTRVSARDLLDHLRRLAIDPKSPLEWPDVAKFSDDVRRIVGDTQTPLP
ncbi:MAG: hypothetical protein KDB00_10925 [Planctomycetales bacterium]|nr:hypothetical protein [Planctomycetales bacterium]